MDFGRILEEICAEVQPLVGKGRVAEYIPALAQVPSDRFGMVVRTVENEVFTVGDANERFSIQSIAKAFILTQAMRLEGDAIWDRVGREPSGTAFNSLVQLELRATGHRNRAVAHFLKSFGNLHNDADRILDAYFRLCSISMSCVELATAFLYLATGGRSSTGEEIATPRQVKRVNSVMLTCGVYDEAGDYAYRVGLPAKSGVGGGVVAVMPGKFVAAVWSPGLSERGNSLAGTMALELLTTKTALSIF